MKYKWLMTILICATPPYIAVFLGEEVNFGMWIFSAIWIVGINISMQLEEYFGREYNV